MVEVIPGEVIIEPSTNRPASQAQPIQAIAPTGQTLDDAAVRQALATAEANGLDPQTVTMDDFAQGFTPKIEVPQKFLKPDGVVDVEKIQASTKQLDEALQKKEEAVQRTVDDYLREYKEKEAKFRSLPNPDRLAASLPAQAPLAQEVPQTLPQNFEEVVRRDYAADPLGTTARLLDLMIQKKFAPIEEKEKLESVRSNIQDLADRDPRVLRQDVFDAIKAKIANDPDIASRKNPHKAAWLEVKEEMRLGDVSQGASAQPSRPSPVLGGGTPPSAPLASNAPVHPQNVVANLHTLDIRDKKQEAMGDAAVRAMLAGNRG